MKKLKKIILPIFLIIINILFISTPVNALEIPVRVLTDTTPIVIDNTININPQFIDNTNTSTKSFGIGGTVINTLPKDVNIVSTTTYYDQNNNVITTSTITQLLPAETTVEYTNMTDLYKVPTNISVQDIKYYSMNIEVQEIIEENYTPSLIEEYKNKDYLIDAYDINIKVNENNTFDITEKITANFLAENKHGIFRKLPTKNTVERLNGTTSTNRAQITNIKVDNEYTQSREEGNLVLKIGSPTFTVSGVQEYNISYNYNIGKDKEKEYDEFYFNLIGPEWDTAIGNVTFTIEMPKEFDSSKLGFSSGLKGSTENGNVVYSVSDNIIKGKYNGILNPKEALTVRLELEEGYFVGAGYKYDAKDFLSALLPLVFVIIGFLTWLIYGKDKQVVDSVEFYPPEGFNSLDVAFAYNGNVDTMDVTSLLIYLANKGYIKIGEEESNSYFTNHKGFRITKVKDYDGKNINEQLFLDGLFRYKKATNNPVSQAVELDNITSVTDVDLYNRFYITTNKIKNNMNTKENKHKIFEKNSLSKRTLITILIILTFCIITIPPCLKYSSSEMLLFALLFPGIGFSMLIASIVGLNSGGTVYVNGKPSTSKNVSTIFGVIWGLGFGGIPFAAILLPILLNDFVYLFGYIIGIICVFFLFIIIKYIPKRTEEGTLLYGKIKGFKKFLESSEKAQLESMVMQNPKYFYDILPYTYVLGISDKWIKKFETINLQAPNWYDSSTPFNAMAFGSFISNTMNSAHSSMASSPSSSSGGGSGGGGGGSW